MEVRNIDPKDESESSLHAGALGTAKIVRVRQLRHGSLPQQSPAPSPFKFLIDRALNQEAGKAGTVTEAECRVAKDQFFTNVRIAPDPSKKREWTTNGSTKGLEHHREKENLENEDQEAKGGLAQAGLSGVICCQATGQTQVVGPRSIPASISKSSHHAGVVNHRHSTSHKLDSVDLVLGPPATSPYFVQKDDSGNEVWWSPKSKSYEVKDRAGIAGNNPVTTDASKQVGYVGSVLRLRSGQPTSSTQRAPAPDSHHNAEIVRTDSRGSPRESQSAPGNPAPNCNHQNADSTGDVSQLAISSRNIAVLPRRSAPHSSDGTHGIGLHCSPVGRCLRSLIGFLRKLSVKIGNKSAYHDPSKARVNGRWVRREVYEKYR